MPEVSGVSLEIFFTADKYSTPGFSYGTNYFTRFIETPLHMKTKKIEKVLIALDYNPSAEKFAESGPSGTKAIKAEVVILFVISDKAKYATAEALPMLGVGAYLGVIPMQFENTVSLKKWANHLHEKIKNTLGDESISTLIEEGDITLPILSAAKASNADIIAMGSHSRRWLENIVMRSVIQEVMRKQNC
jgi:nucleotide-binding universal stress UspA family protein